MQFICKRHCDCDHSNKIDCSFDFKSPYSKAQKAYLVLCLYQHFTKSMHVSLTLWHTTKRQWYTVHATEFQQISIPALPNMSCQSLCCICQHTAPPKHC